MFPPKRLERETGTQSRESCVTGEVKEGSHSRVEVKADGRLEEIRLKIYPLFLFLISILSFLNTGN